MRINTNIKAKDHLRATLSDFRGLDSSKAVLDIAKTRSSSMRNFINKDGVNRKRNGWEQKLQFLDSNRKPMQINGVFNFTLKGKDFFIVYAGTTFYSLFYSLDGNLTKTDITLSGDTGYGLDTNLLTSTITQMFISNNRAYFIGCGDFLVFGDWETEGGYQLRRVFENSDTYLPTTTIHITEDGSTAGINRKSLDEVNILTNNRINKAYISKTGEASKSFTLDATDISTEGITVEVETVVSDVNTIIKLEASGTPVLRSIDIGDNISGKAIEITSGNTIISYSALLRRYLVWEGGYIEWRKTSSSLYSLYIVTSEGDTLIANAVKDILGRYLVEFIEQTVTLPISGGVVYTKYGSNLNNIQCILPSKVSTSLFNGETVVGTVNATTGQVIFDASFVITPPTTEDNITVTFAKHYGRADMERVTHCTIGTLFGANGNTDRLFLSGNDKYRNIVFHSAQDDFTYFSDLDIQAQGSDNTAVMGFQRFTDDTLAIYKEASRQEPNLYIVKTDTQYTYDADGNIDTMKVIFPNSGSYIAQGLISKYAVGAIANDPLILSKNGVYGIELSSNVTSQERFTRERSRPINALLKTHDLSKAVSLIFDNRYYLCVDSKCYVADSRYRYSLDKDMDDTFSYEWWLLDNLPARVFGIVNNEIWFGTDDGRLCKFDDKFTDRKYDTTYWGEIAFANNEFTYNQYIRVLDLADNDIVRFTTYVFTQILDTAGYTVSNNRIVCPDEVITTLVNGTEVYADNVNGTGLSTGIKYIISDIDLGNCTFALRDEGTIVTIRGTGFKLHKNLRNVNVKLIDVDIESHTFKIASTLGGEPILLSRYNLTVPTGLIMDFCTIDNVVAEWYTGAFDFGASDYSKSLLGLTIVSDQTVNSKISFGYETRSLLGLLNNNKGSYREQRTPSFDFSHLDFENFTFETAFTRAYTKRLKVRNFNHIMFVIKSEDDNDCAVYSITVTYKVNRINKGVN